MNSKIVILLTLLGSFIDFGLNILLTYLAVKGRFVQQITSYSFGGSLFDLVILSYLRFCLVSGTIAYLVASKNKGLETLCNIKRTVLYICVVVCVLVAIKLLYFAEDSKKLLDESFPTKALFAVSVLANPLLYFQWWSIKNLKFKKPLADYINVQECNSGEDESLLSNSSSSSTHSDTDSVSEDEQADDKPLKTKKSTGSVVLKLLRYSAPDIWYIVLAFIFLLTASVCEIFLPYFYSQVINAVAIIKSDKMFKKYILLMAVISIAASIATALRASTFTYIMARFTVRIQNELFAHIMKQEIGFFDKKKTGSIISRLTSDTTKVGDQISLNINILLRNLVKICGILVFMAKLSWKLTIVTLVGTPILAMIAEAYGNYYEEISKKVQDSLALANVDAQESIASVRTVRSFAAEDIEIQRYSKKLGDVFKLKVKEAIASGGFHLTTEMCFLAMECLVMFYGGHLVMQGDLSGGNLVAFSFYSFELAASIEDISDVYTSLMEAVGASRKVFAYLERTPRILNDGTLKPPSLKGSIEFRNITFSYPTRPNIPVLEDVSFKVNPGEIVALVGPSGGGKSTVVKLLEHFYEPQYGQVLIDGRSVNEYNHVFIHNKMTLVAQEPVLFARSITENITYGSSGIEKERIQEAAEHANAHCFITELSEGYETQTGEKGVQLSGGQKQRVAIARALIRNPSILILDEATSALDSESEFQVQEAINSNLVNRTVIVIAHRLSTIERADKILVIEKGRLVEQGTHEELIGKGGTYSRLVQKQLVGKAIEKRSDDSRNDGFSASSSSSSSSSSPSNSLPKSFGALPRVGFMRK